MALNSCFRAIPLLSALVALFSASPLLVNAAPRRTAAHSKGEPERFNGTGFYDVRDGGGRWLTYAAHNGSLGEPLNIVVSNKSHPYILTEAGFQDWCLSIQYAKQFMDLTLGGKQQADLGDGNGPHNQTNLLRYDYFDLQYGTLNETVIGGPHVRYWKQNGTKANSNAWFLAASVEKSLSEGHMIVPNGYDRGRDEFVRNATSSNETVSPVSHTKFSAKSEYHRFLPAHSRHGINHAIPTDGYVAMLTVKVIRNEKGKEGLASKRT